MPDPSDPVAEHFLDAMPDFHQPIPFSDDDLAERWVARHGQDWRYVAAWNRWLHWTGTYWQDDQTQVVINAAQEICRFLVNSPEAAVLTPTQQKRLNGLPQTTNLLSFAGAHRTCAATIDQWDADPWQLCTPAGVLNLASGTMRSARRDDYMRSCTAVAPGGSCALWRGHLATITDGDEELQAYLQRIAGYTLTGTTLEHTFFFCYGSGANGKSVFLSTLSTILGSYAKHANVEMFLASKSDRPTHEVAELHGARMVLVDEVKKHRAFDESRINSITSAKKLTACRKYEHAFEFAPVLKLYFAGNEKCELSGGVDEAIRRRIHIIPFRVTIPKDQRDIHFSERLQQEYPGILQWMIEGCAMWQEQGLAPPQVVLDATNAYLEAEEALANWLDDKCVLGPDVTAPISDLYASYTAYCEQEREKPMRCKRLLADLHRHGVERVNEYGLRCAKGIRLKI